MAEVKTSGKEPVVVATQPAGNSFFKRELNGATFLSLEHVGHMVLVVVVAILLAIGVVNALSLWTGNSGVMGALGTDLGIGGPGARYVEATAAIGVVASLAVLVPLMVVLDRRTRAEWVKRPGYTNRAAYKVPIYVALGVLVAGKVSAVVQMLTVVLSSLAVIGMNGQDVGGMYLNSFLPSLIVAIIFGAAAWYLFKLAKGRDNGRAFSIGAALVAGVLAIALFVTAVIVMRTPSTTREADYDDSSRYFDDFNDSSELEDLFRQ